MLFDEFVEINPKVKLEKGKEYSFVDMGVVSSSRRYVSAEQHRIFKSGGAKFQSGDTLFARITPCLENGKIAQYKGSDEQRGFGSTEFFVFRSVKGVSDPSYVYYLSLTEAIRGPAEKSMFGASGRQRADLSVIKNIDVGDVPLEVQKKISSILAAYDNLIEINLRRIRILEEMAQLIYREWFVKFRFPGHEKVKMVDSALGEIPEGWEAIKFAELLSSSLGGDWGSAELTSNENEEVKIIRGTDFSDVKLGYVGQLPIRFIKPNSLEKRRLLAGDIIVENSVNAKSRSAGNSIVITDGVLHRLGENTISASFCRTYRPKDRQLSSLIHTHMKYLFNEGKMAFYQNVAANGIANFQTKRFLEEENLVLPSNPDQKKMMLETFRLLLTFNIPDKNYLLRQTWDLLLPNLISGQLDVSELDIDIGETAA